MSVSDSQSQSVGNSQQIFKFHEILQTQTEWLIAELQLHYHEYEESHSLRDSS